MQDQVASPMIVRALTPADAAAYVALRAESLRLEPFSFGASPEDDVASSVEFVRARLTESNRATFGAFNPGLVGAVGINRNATTKGAHKAHIWGMYVAPDRRRAGAGMLLMQAAVEFARGMPGVQQIHLCVSERSVGAAAMYHRLGFRTWGIEPGAMQVDGVVVDEHHMILDLTRSGGSR